jgi:hypothetical protein
MANALGLMLLGTSEPSHGIDVLLCLQQQMALLWEMNETASFRVTLLYAAMMSWLVGRI